MAETIKVGDAAPAVTLKDEDGNDVNLGDFIGKQEVVLIFFPFTWSPVCTNENTCVTNDLEKFSEKGAKVFAISVDSWFSQKAWKDALSLKHDFLSDLTLAAADKYGLIFDDLRCTQRATVVIGTDGNAKYVKVQPILEARDDAEILAQLG
jgi:peroxiredoxin